MSHHQPRVVPWRNSDELVLLKNDFYPDFEFGTPDRRPAALAKVQAWQVRARVPHAIESTAQLTSAVLLDTSTSGASALHLRLSYSTAICRFVNGLLDPAQQSQFALPMHLLAKNLNLPASFVELRHAATHEALPSLVVLRAVALRALDWLWCDYWAAIGVERDERAAGGAEEDVIVTRARSVIKTWRRLRRDNPVKEIKSGDSSAAGKEVAAVIKECVDICKLRQEEDEGMQALIAALLEEKALIPSGKKKAAVPGFLEGLLEAMVEVLKAGEELSAALLREARAGRPEVLQTEVLQTEDVQPSYDTEFLAAIVAWLEFLTALKQTRSGSVGASVDIEELIKQALLQPNEWNMQLLNHLISEYPNLRPKYQALIELAAIHVQARSSGKSKQGHAVGKRSREAIEAEIDAFEERFNRIQQQRERTQVVVVPNEEKKTQFAGKWKRWEKTWIPKPLGIV
ncbi:Las1-like-domain-containing protein [Trichophaea hybrida]|nr:Las1-like-domain-containing protein [Trichophaea hybrida]